MTAPVFKLDPLDGVMFNVVSVNWLYTNLTKHVNLVHNRHHHFIKKVTCSRHDVIAKLNIWP